MDDQTPATTTPVRAADTPSSSLVANDLPATERGRRTRSALIRSAREVFEEQGFIDARIADIADKAGVAHGSFYTYFESKEAIFREVMNAIVGDVFSASHPGVGVPNDPIARIEAATRLYLQAYSRNARMLAILDQVATFNDYFRQLKLEMRTVFVNRNVQGIMRLQRQGLADPKLDALTAAHQLGGMVEKFAELWLGLGQPFDEDIAIDTLTRLWAQGLGLKMPDE